jgi:hypothetical protein
MEAHRISQEAQFIVDSLPNAEQPAVERVLHQLGAIGTILRNLDDPHSAPETTIALEAYMNGLIQLLEHFYPPSLACSHIPMNTTGSRNRPSYQLDLDRAVLLHDLGNTWSVSRKTLCNHMANTGRSMGRREWTEISDIELDEKVAEVSLLHPFSGLAIISGHLETRGIHVSRKCVQDSLRRVDEIGVLVRYVPSCMHQNSLSNKAIRWSGTIKLSIYKVRRENTLLHNDGNEKLRPWGFSVHGCVDGLPTDHLPGMPLKQASEKYWAAVHGFSRSFRMARPR